MGFNTACVILNDTLHELARDPTAGADIRTAVLEAGNPHIPLAGHGRNGFQALQSVHADTAQIVVVGGNTIRSLGYGCWSDSDEQLLRKLADQMGFRLARKPSERDAPPANTYDRHANTKPEGRSDSKKATP